MACSAFHLFDDGADRMAGKTVAVYVGLALGNIAAWAWAWIAFADRPTLLGTALLAYLFGLRHGVDADHIAAIDNVVRKLMQDGKRPIGTGLFFSLGHSSVVVVASAAIAVTTAALHDQFAWFKSVGGMIGTGVSAIFLLAIGIANLLVLRSIWAAFRRARRGEAIDHAHTDGLVTGGLIARVCGPLFRVIGRSWHMYPLGMLFGLGFDTATEVGLLGISAAQSVQGLSIWSILVFPALFTAGMALVDTTDTVLMIGAYGWAFVKPIRKLWYNLTITATSVAVAVVIGGIEAGGLVAEKLGTDSGFWQMMARLNDALADLGFVIMAVFAVAWAVSAVVYRWRGPRAAVA
jgi:high-affinity nickel-transport protein